MNLRSFFIMILVLSGLSAQADDEQIALARQIEEASLTPNQSYFYTVRDSNAGSGVGWVLYPPLKPRREMEVNGCDVTARTIKNHFNDPMEDMEEPYIEITFDLARTRIPDASVPIGNGFWFMNEIAEAAFDLYFVPPYQPMLWSKTAAGVEVEQPLLVTWYRIELVADEAQTRRLLALLNQYQDEYCTFFG